MIPTRVGHPTRKRPARSLTVLVQSPCRTSASQPVTVGVPLPKGALLEPEGARLVDALGSEVGLQAAELARWTDGSVKWLLLDFVLGPVPEGQTRLMLELSAPADDAARDSIRIVEAGRAVIVETGPAAFSIDRASPSLLEHLPIDGEPVIDPDTASVWLTDRKGRRARPRIDRVDVEALGPVRATLRLEGAFEGRARCRFVARLCFFAGTGLVRIRTTLHNPDRARHRGGLWDLGDPGSFLFRDFSLDVALTGGGRSQCSWSSEPGLPEQVSATEEIAIFQASSGGERWNSSNHVNREGRVPCPFRGYRAEADGRKHAGLRANPILAVDRERGTFAAAVPEFWQQFPKSIESQGGGRLTLGLFPERYGDPFELQGGERKTTTSWLCFGPAGERPGRLLDWVHRPARVHATPEGYAASGAIAHLSPAADERLASYLEDAVDGERGLAARREVIDEYGWRNYGEVFADHEAAEYPGTRPPISHYNNQYDLVYGALLQYLRTGDARWYDLFDPLARHVIDIDIYHTDRDKAAYNGGYFWFTDHFKDAATCTHRTYSRRNGDRHYGGGPSSNHNFTTGLLHYHYLTGDPDAREAVIGLADWVIRMDDGRRTPFGRIDPGPTGLASQTGTPDNHGPGRGAGNSVNALLDAWLLTGGRRYLDEAEVLIRRCIHPEDDIPSRRLLNAEKHWSYPIFLAALARYLDLKAEARELDRMYAYARLSLVAYASWMLDHETPYLSRPEALEFPTETWAAQELRKANVLRLAAAHADEPLRSALLRRGEELADVAWSQLLGFESRNVARALTLMMSEGPLDESFRLRFPGPAPRPSADHAFEPPETFVPQKARVLRRLKTAGGWIGILLHLAGVTRSQG
jgi:hypothetical protein